jgi:vacuolar protein sorting-associated protein 13A/C
MLILLFFIKFNLSFSVNGKAHTDDKEIKQGAGEVVLFFFLESIGATITEFKDVRFRFNEFSLRNAIKTWKELYDETFDHYKIQTLHQAYVLILGLDVLGNPFGLVSEFSQNLQDLFYDPLLGYLSKNQQDFHMRRKIKTTVDKTISSVAGSGSLITGSIGRVLAAVTFDKEYKQVRFILFFKFNYSKSVFQKIFLF